METPLLDNAPMLEQRGDHFCCLLCQRQFASEVQLRKHLTKSSLHADNLAAAEAAGRVAAVPTQQPREQTKRPAPDEAAPPPKRERSEATSSGSIDCGAAASSHPPASQPPASLPEASSSRLSALEQMELFEKRLKVEAKRQPEKDKEEAETTAIVDSNRARTMNNQMDWECSGCSMVRVRWITPAPLLLRWVGALSKASRAARLCADQLCARRRVWQMLETCRPHDQISHQPPKGDQARALRCPSARVLTNIPLRPPLAVVAQRHRCHVMRPLGLLLNRLSSLCLQRVCSARYFANDEAMAGKVHQPQQLEQRSDGSHPMRADRASFSQR